MTHALRRFVPLALLLATLALAGAASGAVERDARSSAITLRDGLGRTVTIPRPAKRVVALEWTYGENVLALQGNLVGMADIKNYRVWLKTPPVKSSVVDVGTRQQPSLEAIAALEPDLILTASIRVGESLRQLSAIAPTLVFDPYRKDASQYGEMEATFRTIAKAVGKEARARMLLKQLTGTYGKGRTLLRRERISRVTVAQAYTTGGQSVARLFTSNALVSQVLQRMGLTIGWRGDPGQYGFTTVGLEGITTLPDDGYLLYVAQPNDNPFAGNWASSSAYRALPMVRAGRVVSLRPDTWFFGGPVSMGQFVRQVLARLTEK